MPLELASVPAISAVSARATLSSVHTIEPGGTVNELPNDHPIHAEFPSKRLEAGWHHVFWSVVGINRSACGFNRAC